jgi:hypothetical protein
MADIPQDETYDLHEDRPRPARLRSGPARAAGPDHKIPAAKAKGMGRLEWITVIVLLAVVIPVVVVMAVRQNLAESATRDAHQAAVASYLFTPVEPVPGAARPRLGKVVAVDLDKRAFDQRVFNLIPLELKAEATAEVTTVARIQYTRREVGRFEMGAAAVELSCTMTVADLATHATLGTRTFAWGPPPKAIPRGGDKSDITGTAPAEEIVAFLTGLR